MQRITKDQALKYEVNGQDEPLLRVRQGESFVVETFDAQAGNITSAEDAHRVPKMPNARATPGKGNPVGGPVFVEGAEAGDLLEVSIEKIIVEEQGWTNPGPRGGPLGGSYDWPGLHEPYVRIFKHLPGPSGTTRDGKGVFSDKITWDLQPFIGTVAVAPEREIESTTIGQGPWGGNLDVRDMKEGTRCYINCYHEGGLLYLGDVHASQGDTEFTGSADETGAELTLSCRVVKNKRIPFLRLEKEETIVSLFSARPLEDAVHAAIENLMRWMVDDYGVSEVDAYTHMSVNPDFRVNVYQMARVGRLMYTAGAEIPRRYLVPS